MYGLKVRATKLRVNVLSKLSAVTARARDRRGRVVCEKTFGDWREARIWGRDRIRSFEAQQIELQESCMSSPAADGDEAGGGFDIAAS